MKAFRLLIAAVALLSASTTYAQARQNGFSVILLVGDTQPAAVGDGLPPSAAVHRALADVKDFLPYRSYRVLDSQWMRNGSTRMKGFDDQEYEVNVTGDDVVDFPPFQKKKEGWLNIQFKLQEAGAAVVPGEEFARSAQAAELEKQVAGLRVNSAELAAKYGERHPARLQVEARIADLEKRIRMARSRKLIESKFEMAIGETVVVGTSKVGGGDKGLVVLLTSVTAGGK